MKNKEKDFSLATEAKIFSSSISIITANGQSKEDITNRNANARKLQGSRRNDRPTLISRRNLYREKFKAQKNWSHVKRFLGA